MILQTAANMTGTIVVGGYYDFSGDDGYGYRDSPAYGSITNILPIRDGILEGKRCIEEPGIFRLYVNSDNNFPADTSDLTVVIDGTSYTVPYFGGVGLWWAIIGSQPFTNGAAHSLIIL